jgi:hypothetical protein
MRMLFAAPQRFLWEIYQKVEEDEFHVELARRRSTHTHTHTHTHTPKVASNGMVDKIECGRVVFDKSCTAHGRALCSLATAPGYFYFFGM